MFVMWWSETIKPLSRSPLTRSRYVSSSDQEIQCIDAIIHEIDSCMNDSHGTHVC